MLRPEGSLCSCVDLILPSNIVPNKLFLNILTVEAGCELNLSACWSSHQGWLCIKNHDISTRDNFSSCNRTLSLLFSSFLCKAIKIELFYSHRKITSVQALPCLPTDCCPHDLVLSSNVSWAQTKPEGPWILKAKLNASKVREGPIKSFKFVVWLFSHSERLVSHSNGIIF